MKITAYELAARFLGLHETTGPKATPAILAMLDLDDESIQDDATPWCSAFVNFVAWELGLPRSKSLAARSWLPVGRIVQEGEAAVGFDVVVLTRNGGPLDPTVLDAPGHVGFFGGLRGPAGARQVCLLGGNQGDAVTLAWFPASQVLGYRRLFEES